nr:MAG TPA: hypothetical protein [Caudoviricetes sp.]
MKKYRPENSINTILLQIKSYLFGTFKYYAHICSAKHQ